LPKRSYSIVAVQTEHHADGEIAPDWQPLQVECCVMELLLLLLLLLNICFCAHCIELLAHALVESTAACWLNHARYI
jgi:hypothetical protein